MTNTSSSWLSPVAGRLGWEETGSWLVVNLKELNPERSDCLKVGFGLDLLGATGVREGVLVGIQVA